MCMNDIIYYYLLPIIFKKKSIFNIEIFLCSKSKFKELNSYLLSPHVEQTFFFNYNIHAYLAIIDTSKASEQ